MSGRNEKELAQQAMSGDIAAFEELITAERPRLYSFALGMAGGNHADAADVLQEAFVKAFVNIKRFRGDSSFATWIWRIVRNEFINYRKALGTKAIQQDDEEVSGIAAAGQTSAVQELILAERREKLLETVALLPPKYREVLVMIEIREQSYEETAQLLDLSMSALKTRLMRSREKLSELIRKRRKYFL